jgi:hypothetical protein
MTALIKSELRRQNAHNNNRVVLHPCHF